MAIYDFFLSRNSSTITANTYIGHEGRLFYDSTNGVVKLSDGVTPGGLAIPYTVATSTVIGGIKAGAGANVSTDGTLTIDTAGLPLSFGDFTTTVGTYTNNEPYAVLSSVNANEDVVIASNGDGSVCVVGTFHVHPTNGDLTDTLESEPSFVVKADGQVEIRVTQLDAQAGAIEIIGSSTGDSVPPGIDGTMLHITGQRADPCRLYFDGNGDYVSIVGRRWNGNLTAGRTQVLAGQDVMRINATAQTDASLGNVSLAQISFTALENQTTTAQGSEITFTVTPVGSPATSRVDVANVTVADGITTTKAKILGNLTVLGNIIGNAVATTATLGSATVTGNITTGNISITGSISSNVKISGSNATANNFNKNGGTVTADGRTGQITSLNDSIAKGSAVTFTVNNSYVLSNKDVVIVNIASGASDDAYTVSVTAVATGSFKVTIANSASGALAEALVFNFAVISVA
jgi:hypothetical protein